MNNVTKTTVEEAVICLRNAGFPVDALLSQMHAEKSRTAKAESQLKALMYPDKKLSYYMADRMACIINLSTDAAKILRILQASIVQTGLVSFSYDDIRIIAGIGSKQTVRKAVDELIDTGAMARVRQGGSHVKAVYCINPRIARCGTDSGQTETFRNAVSVETHIINLDSVVSAILVREKNAPAGCNKALTYTLLQPIGKQKKAAGSKTDDSLTSCTKSTMNNQPSSTGTGCKGQLTFDDLIKDGELPEW